MMRLSYILLILVGLLGCSNTSTAPPDKPNPPDPLPDDGSCATIWNRDITVPTTLTNTASLCDYLLEGYVEVNSRLIIEPGVVIRAKQDAVIKVDGGEVLAVGDANNRITLEGLSHVAGFWGGLHFYQARESRIEYVDFKDAGQVCTIIWCADAALKIDGVALSLKHSTVSNSYVHGVYVSEDVAFTDFEDNRFYGNSWAGLLISGNLVPVLDTKSDYLGQEVENGRPFVLISNGNQTAGREFRWKKLNAPYLIGGYFYVEGGILSIDPGVTLVFDEEGWMTVRGNGELRAIGTEAEPITFKGRKEEPGYWDGISFWDSDWDGNEFNYVRIHHSGFTDGLSDAYGAIRLRYESKVTVQNSVIASNAMYGIACDEPSDYVGTPELILGAGNTFRDNGAGDIDPDCGIEP